MFTSLTEAAIYAGVTKQAILVWVNKYNIGELRDGRWYIMKSDIDRVRDGLDQIKEIRASLRGR